MSVASQIIGAINAIKLTKKTDQVYIDALERIKGKMTDIVKSVLESNSDRVRIDANLSAEPAVGNVSRRICTACGALQFTPTITWWSSILSAR